MLEEGAFSLEKTQCSSNYKSDSKNFIKNFSLFQ